MSTVPTSIKVLVLPPDYNTKPHYETIETVATKIRSSDYDPNKPHVQIPFLGEFHLSKMFRHRLPAAVPKLSQDEWDDCQKEATTDFVCFSREHVGAQPNVARLPDVKSRWNGKAAWEKRKVFHTDKYHVLFTPADTEDEHHGYPAFGEVFILKLSDPKDKDKDRQRFYVDVEDNLDYWELGHQILVKVWNVKGDGKKQPEYR